MGVYILCSKLIGMFEADNFPLLVICSDNSYIFYLKDLNLFAWPHF